MKRFKHLASHPLAKLFTGYLVCAGVATLVDFTALYLLTDFLHFWYFYSAAIAYFFGMITNYSLNKYFNFKDENPRIAKQFGKFFIVATGGLVLNQIIIFGLVEYVKAWYLLAKCVATLLVAAYSFYYHKKFTFKK